MKVYVVSDSGESLEANLKAKVRDAGRRFKDWFNRNRDTILILTPVVIGGVATVTKVVGKRINLHKEEAVKNLFCYDRSLGHYWSLRRELSNREWLEIDTRKKNGERLSDILSELKVLK